MTKTSPYLPLIPLLQKFIAESASGKRLQKNGMLISKPTIKNYNALLANLVKYSEYKKETIEINVNYKYTKRNFSKEKKYYQKFYKQFTDFLYTRQKCTDNYVGMLIKNLRALFIYLNTTKGYETGQFYKSFYTRKEETPIIVLSQEQLQFMINNDAFNQQLTPHLKTTKDVFVFGCTVGLRFSDLKLLKPRNLEFKNGSYYIITKSKKTNVDTRIKLPTYAIEIIKSYHKKQSTLLPVISLNQFNKNIKNIGEIAGWTHEIGKMRSKRGVRKELKTKNGKTYRFCDLLSSHVMRRTAITTLLTLGMPEPLVRKISGHAANSKEFYKYVKYSESFLDEETDRAFNKLITIA